MVGQHQERKERHVLVIDDGQHRAFALDAAAYSIGRDPSNAIVINSDTISRQHAILLRVPNPQTKRYQYRLIDGNSQGKPSANGIYINDQRTKSHELMHGDVIGLGRKIKASYQMVSMTEAEFAKYLESTSFHSIKSDLVTAKETLVSFDMMGAKDQSAGSVISKPSASSQSSLKASSRATVWEDNGKSTIKTTLHHAHNQTSESSSSGFRLWMGLVVGIIVVAIGAGGAWMVFGSQGQTEPGPSEPSTQSLKQ